MSPSLLSSVMYSLRLYITSNPSSCHNIDPALPVHCVYSVLNESDNLPWLQKANWRVDKKCCLLWAGLGAVIHPPTAPLTPTHALGQPPADGQLPSRWDGPPGPWGPFTKYISDQRGGGVFGKCWQSLIKGGKGMNQMLIKADKSRGKGRLVRQIWTITARGGGGKLHVLIVISYH